MEREGGSVMVGRRRGVVTGCEGVRNGREEGTRLREVEGMDEKKGIRKKKRFESEGVWKWAKEGSERRKTS